MISGIYAIRNTETGKYYVGSTKNFKKRWGEHRYHLKKGSHHSLKLQRSFDKHGLASFEFSILKQVEDADRLEEIEAEFIELYQAWTNGYNVLNRGTKFSDYPEGSMRNVKDGKFVNRISKPRVVVEKERLSIRLSPKRLQKLRDVASVRDVTMTNLIEQWIEALPDPIDSQP